VCYNVLVGWNWVRELANRNFPIGGQDRSSAARCGISSIGDWQREACGVVGLYPYQESVPTANGARLGVVPERESGQ